jgi:hypothetical protein
MLGKHACDGLVVFIFILTHLFIDTREEAVGIGQPDSVAKYGIGESVGRSGEIIEDDYGISVKAERRVN